MTGDDPRHPAHRHGRLLRLGRTGAPPRACRASRHRRRLRREPRRGEHRLLRGSCLRRAHGHAHRPGPAPLPAGRLPAGRHEGLSGRRRTGCSSSSGASPTWSSRSRSTRPSSTSPAPGASSARRRRSPRQIQELVRDELGLSCSIGIGPTRLLAKLAAELDKPGGLDDAHQSRRPRPSARASGAQSCTASGRSPRSVCAASGSPPSAGSRTSPTNFSPAPFPAGSAALKELAFGGSDDVVRAGHAPPKSMGHEVTFASDISDPELLQATLLDLADRAAGDLRRKGYACRTLALKLRDEQLSHLRRTAHPAGRDQLHQAHLRDRLGAALRPARERLPAAPARPHPERPHRRGPPARARRLLARGGLR